MRDDSIAGAIQELNSTLLLLRNEVVSIRILLSECNRVSADVAKILKEIQLTSKH